MTKSAINRRTILQALSGSACLAGCGLAPTLLAANQPLTETPLTERISFITGAGGNICVYQGASGLTLIDSGSGVHNKALLKLLHDKHSAKPVTTLVNTHWHEDHSGGNEAFHQSGSKILAHENTRLWMSADFYVEWRQHSYSPRPVAALPDTTFYTSDTIQLDTETIELHHYAQAHTDGDICVFFPDSNVMIAGGLLSNYRYPVTDIATGGWIGGLIEANQAMLALTNDTTIIVPDIGPALTKRDLQAQHDMLSELFEEMKTLARLGYSGKNMLTKGVTAKFDKIWGDPEEFVLETYRGMWAHTYDMGGFI